ncbi:hypothetical protein A7X81_03660 [Campylobacter ornithocola]|uniref:Uncharacterized protein n=1 Tax=Campylobacter ornithocola TaxID=1848766 RepID=A0A6M8MUY2_9BACT|nr:hypothetical protein [Campylobacter ornithocola]OCX42298.1 hypothetical protein A7X81_03660 [Campylobacter ornithocola]QKF57176.1 hypothetical protein CORN_0646 [Campylobacter ornithocola]
MSIPHFKASLEVALGAKKPLRARRGFTKVANTIFYGGLSMDALALYLQLKRMSEKTLVSEIYLRELILIKKDTRISLQRLRLAKDELINFNLLQIKKTNYHRFNYEWILKDENNEIIKHFNKTEYKLKSADKKPSKIFKNNTSSVVGNLNTEKEKNENSLYIETRTHAYKENNININNNKFINLENLENKENTNKNNNATRTFFVVDFGALKTQEFGMGKFKKPSVDDLMEQINTFNQKHGTYFDESLAEDFIEYWDVRQWKRGDKKMASVAGSLHTWLKYAKENALRKNAFKVRKKEAEACVVSSLMDYYRFEDNQEQKYIDVVSIS